jgi:hypothetical protein
MGFFSIFFRATGWLDLELNFGRRRVPVSLQVEQAEYGLAYLAMLASVRSPRTKVPSQRSWR